MLTEWFTFVWGRVLVIFKKVSASTLLIYLFMAMLYLCECFLCFMKTRHNCWAFVESSRGWLSHISWSLLAWSVCCTGVFYIPTKFVAFFEAKYKQKTGLHGTNISYIHWHILVTHLWNPRGESGTSVSFLQDMYEFSDVLVLII